MLCRFSVSTFAQRGQRCCLREKAVPEVAGHRAQTEIENETWTVLLPEQTRRVEQFLDGTACGATRFRKGLRKGEDGADGTLITLKP